LKTFEMTRPMTDEINTNMAILPIGSLEQHGPHLPICTDILIAESYAELAAKALSAFLLPCIPISTCKEHMGYRGSVWFSPETFSHMITDLCMSLRSQGFKKLALIVGHGGIFILPPTIREINATQNPDFFVCQTNVFYYEEYAQRGLLESKYPMHADEFETSLIMYLRPDLVHKDLIADFVPNVPREYLNYGSIFRYSPSGVWGEPSLASPEKGESLLKAGTEYIVQYIKNVFAFIENKDKLGYSYF